MTATPSHSRRLAMTLVLSACLLILTTGCGSSNIGNVSGLVTLDGTPVEGAAVAFHPTEGRASIGRTGANGRYELTYTKDESGAVIGAHKVTICTQIYSTEGADSEGNPTLIAGKPETMLPRYNHISRTVLTADVKAGSNKVDFALTSQE